MFVNKKITHERFMDVSWKVMKKHFYLCGNYIVFWRLDITISLLNLYFDSITCLSVTVFWRRFYFVLIFE